MGLVVACRILSRIQTGLVFFALLQEFGPFAQATMREWFNQDSPIAGRLLFWELTNRQEPGLAKNLVGCSIQIEQLDGTVNWRSARAFFPMVKSS